MKMKKTMTIVMAGNSSGPMRRITIPSGLLVVLAAVVVVCLGLVGYVVYDYGVLRKEAHAVEVLQNRLASHRAHLSEQRQQITALTGRINDIKSQLGWLNEFEKKIRVIANLTTTSDAESLFGVGGIPPAEIVADPDMERPNSLLREMHNQLNMLDSAFVSQEKSFAELLTYLRDKRRLLASTPAIRPINGGWITSRFAYRKSPFTGRREFHH
ncbi:MAG: hypothetical protein ACLFPD_10285, partial [Desulfosudaceae bacterium]